TSGSPPAMEIYAAAFYTKRSLKGIAGTDYLQFMSHTCAANLAQFFGITGRVMPTCSACTAGSQGIGYAYEAIVGGRQNLMVAGGAEELHAVNAAVFDIMFATSTRNDEPERTPRPFDRARDGLVVGEGAGTLVLEELEHARARGARIYAEVAGFGTNGDGTHITNPDVRGMQTVMELALRDARLRPRRAARPPRRARDEQQLRLRRRQHVAHLHALVLVAVGHAAEPRRRHVPSVASSVGRFG